MVRELKHGVGTFMQVLEKVVVCRSIVGTTPRAIAISIRRRLQLSGCVWCWAGVSKTPKIQKRHVQWTCMLSTCDCLKP
jgi:hypothetical protein